MGGPLGDHETLDGPAALSTRFPLSAVDTESLEELSGSAVGKEIRQVVEGGAPVGDTCLEYRHDGRMDPSDLLTIEGPDTPGRMDTRAVKHFVRVDVAESSDEALIQEGRLDRRHSITERLDELLDRRQVRERIASDPRETRFGQLVGGEDCDEPERSRIDEPEFLVSVRCEDGVGVWHLGLARTGDLHPTGHAEMDHPGQIVLDARQDELPLSADVDHTAAGESLAHVGRTDVSSGRAGPPHLDAIEPGTRQHRLDEPSGGLHFGQLGHMTSLQPPRGRSQIRLLRLTSNVAPRTVNVNRGSRARRLVERHRLVLVGLDWRNVTHDLTT